MILLGALVTWRPVITWLLKMQNIMRGTQSNITEGTIKFYRILGLFIILLGILFIITVSDVGIRL